MGDLPHAESFTVDGFVTWRWYGQRACGVFNIWSGMCAHDAALYKRATRASPEHLPTTCGFTAIVHSHMVSGVAGWLKRGISNEARGAKHALRRHLLDV